MPNRRAPIEPAPIVVEEPIIPLEQQMLDVIFNGPIRPIDDDLGEAPAPEDEGGGLIDLDEMDREFEEMVIRARDAGALEVDVIPGHPIAVPVPGPPPVMMVWDEVAGPMGLGEMRARLAQDRVRQHFDRGRRRAAHVVRDGDAEIPADAVEEPAVPRLQQVAAPKKAVAKKAAPKKHVYPEEGHMHRGRKFARALTMGEQMYYSDYGFTECIHRYPDLEFKEQEKPIDETEECIILMSELSDYLATEECKRTIDNFDLKTHFKEYQASYKKFLKVVSGFKRNKHG